MKATSALSGPNDAVIQPRGSTKLDWEVELAFVIGTECRCMSMRQRARPAIAGYFVCNDVSGARVSAGARRAMGQRQGLR